MPAPGFATHDVGLSAAAPLPRPATASEHMAAASTPLWYAPEPQLHPHHHPYHHHHHHHEYPGYATLSGLRRGTSSCGSKSRDSRRSSDQSLTRSEIKAALRGATADLVGDLTREIRAELSPLLPPLGSPTTPGASPHRLHAGKLVAGLSHTLGGVRSRPMPTPAVVPRSPFVPRTAQPPYSHVANSSRAELDWLGLTALL